MKRLWPILSVLAIISVAALQQWRIARIQRDLTSEMLRSDWAAAQFAIRWSPQGPVWFYNPSNRNEATIIERLRRIYAVRNQNGQLIQYSRTYKDMGLPAAPVSSSAKPRIWEPTTQIHGVRYLLCSGPIRADHDEIYELTIGRVLD